MSTLVKQSSFLVSLSLDLVAETDPCRSLRYKAKQESDAGDGDGGQDESGLSCRMLGGIFVSNW